ncbi:MAG: o-succinylbenzoate synthase, partial [Actinomycetota bacterium]|nr:o-succinylbenzoate synthase [Actinomycetota bacterium]
MTLVEHRLRVPLRTPLGGLDHRLVTLIQGPSGWGEYSPLPGYPCDPAMARAGAEEAATVGWPPAVRDTIAVNSLVPAVGPDEAAALALAGGCSTVKVKVGDPGDLDRVAAVRAAVGPTVALRVDANGVWDIDAAVAAIARMSAYDLEMVEQPVASMEDLAV